MSTHPEAPVTPVPAHAQPVARTAETADAPAPHQPSGAVPPRTPLPPQTPVARPMHPAQPVQPVQPVQHGAVTPPAVTAGLPPHGPAGGTPGGAGAWWQPAPAGAVTSPAPRPRTRWLPLATTATAAALVASLATAGLTGAFADGTGGPAAQGTTQGSAQDPAPDAVGAPVTSSTSDQPDWEAVAAAVRASVVAIDVQTAAGAGKGSGVVIDTDGHVLTNDHVVGDAQDGGLLVTLADGRVFEATIVGLDPTTDLAVIRLDDPPADLTPAALGDSDAVDVGEAVMAVGNPLGLSSTATTGIVSALDRPVSTSDGGDETVVTNAIQIDAAINPGNSGGPLFDATGQVIGITSSIASLPGASVGGSIGLGFAIPVNQAGRIADELIADGTAEHAFLGVSLSDGTATADGTSRRGAVVQEVTPASPAADAGLQQGDVVVAIGGEPVNGAEALTAYVREQEAGSTATLTVVRDGASTEVDVTFAVRDDAVAAGLQPQVPEVPGGGKTDKG